MVNGKAVRNIFVYDAQGQPVTGVQLFGPHGRPIALSPDQAQPGSGPNRVVGCPWFNGTQELFNGFPLPQRSQRGMVSCSAAAAELVGPASQPAPPFAQVPPVSPTPGIGG